MTTDPPQLFMLGQIVQWGTPMVYLAGLLITATSVLLIIRAFRESFNWGIVCLLLYPLGPLMFMIRFWRDMKDIGYVQIFAVVLILGETGRQVIKEEQRSESIKWLRSRAQARESATKVELTNTVASQEREWALREERRHRAGELFILIQAWHKELQQKQPPADAPPNVIAAFSREHANYQALLDEYKKEHSALQQPVRNSTVPSTDTR